VAAWVERRGRALAVRRPEGGLLGGLWDLPGDALSPRERPGPGLRRALRERVGLEVGAVEPIGTVSHLFTHRRMKLHVYRCAATAGRVRLDGFEAHRWMPARSVTGLPLGNVTRKALQLIHGGDS
jgi:adenine-specific DNA glycosylase